MVEMRQQVASVDNRPGACARNLARGAGIAAVIQPAGIQSGDRQSDIASLALSALSATIRNEVLPRLVLAHRVMTAPVAPLDVMGVVWSDPVIELSKLVVHHDATAASALVRAMIAGGTSVEAIYLDVLAPTARRLGVLWNEDCCDIADVTMGLWRLKEVLRDLGPLFLGDSAFLDHGRSALLIPAPGETHSLGLAMVSDFFTRAGWNVSGGAATAGVDIGDWVHATWFTVIGFSVGCDASLEALAAGIRMVRRRSRNRAVGVMVGGPVFTMRPELAAQVGADATATDGLHAVSQAQSLVALLGSR